MLKLIKYEDWDNFLLSPNTNSSIRKQNDDYPELIGVLLNKNNNTLDESLLSVVIAKDTPLARAIARQRQSDIKTALNIDLPIIFYNNYLNDIKHYPKSEMELDGEKTKIEWIDNYHLDSNKKENLDYWEAKTSLKFFGGGSSIKLNGQDYRVPSSIHALMQAVNQHKNKPEVEFFKIIDEVSRAKNFLVLFEDPATQALYNTVQTRRYFGRN